MPDSVYFEYGKTYRVPANVRSRSHQVWMKPPLLRESLAELGVTKAVYFGGFAAGEMLYGTDKHGRKIGFLVDSSAGFELVVPKPRRRRL